MGGRRPRGRGSAASANRRPRPGAPPGVAWIGGRPFFMVVLCTLIARLGLDEKVSVRGRLRAPAGSRRAGRGPERATRCPPSQTENRVWRGALSLGLPLSLRLLSRVPPPRTPTQRMDLDLDLQAGQSRITQPPHAATPLLTGGAGSPDSPPAPDASRAPTRRPSPEDGRAAPAAAKGDGVLDLGMLPTMVSCGGARPMRVGRGRVPRGLVERRRTRPRSGGDLRVSRRSSGNRIRAAPAAGPVLVPYFDAGNQADGLRHPVRGALGATRRARTIAEARGRERGSAAGLGRTRSRTALDPHHPPPHTHTKLTSTRRAAPPPSLPSSLSPPTTR